MAKDWARRFYAIDQNFPDASKQASSKERWNKILELNPSLGEFSRTLPTEQEVLANRGGLIQSEFKKPYEAESYGEMEYSGAGEPGGPVTPAEPEFKFTVDTGKGCPGQLVVWHFIFSHFCTNLKFILPKNDPLIDIIQVNTGSYDYCYLFFPGAPAYHGMEFMLEATMVDPVTGKTGKVNSIMLKTQPAGTYGCPSLYVEFLFGSHIAGPSLVTKSILWDVSRDEVAQGVTDVNGDPVVFPCDPSDLTHFRNIVSGESVRFPTLGYTGSMQHAPYPIAPGSTLPIPVGYTLFYGDPPLVLEEWFWNGTPWHGSNHQWSMTVGYPAVICDFIVNGYENLLVVDNRPFSNAANKQYSVGLWVQEDVHDIVMMAEETQHWFRGLMYVCSHLAPCTAPYYPCSGSCKRCVSCGTGYQLDNDISISASIGNEPWFSGVTAELACSMIHANAFIITDQNLYGTTVRSTLTSDVFIYLAFCQIQFGDTPLLPGGSTPGCGSYPVHPAYIDRMLCGGSGVTFNTSVSKVFISVTGNDAGLVYDDAGFAKMNIDINNLSRNGTLETMIDDLLTTYPPIFSDGGWGISLGIYRGEYRVN
jgi:hypothetical protein